MKKIFIISIIFLISGIFLISPVFASDNSLDNSLDNSENLSIEEQKTSEIIEEQILELRIHIKELEEVRELEKSYSNLVNEISIRQNALFKVIDISLNENLVLISSIEKIEDLDKDIFNQLEKMILRDNQWYQEFILKVNLATSTNELKNLALEIKNHRQGEEILSMRKLIGLIIILEQVKSVNNIEEKIKEFENPKDQYSKDILRIINLEIEEVNQLIDICQTNIENMSNMEDFENIRKELEEINIHLDNIYSDFEKLF